MGGLRYINPEWATPIVPILKPDGTVRICGDFKITINPVLEGTEYPLPKIEHLYANISGSKYFSKVDLKDAYQQMVIKESDRKYATINTHKGLFSYTRYMFGIKSSAEEFQKAMEISTTGVEGIAEQDCLYWGYRVIIPTKFFKSILTELHSCHIGMSSIKSVARSYFWWPNIDKEIEDMTRNCNECINARLKPPKTIMGYLRFTPTPAIKVETVCPPFNIRCRWLAGKFLLKSFSDSKSTIFDTFFSLFLNLRYVKKSLPVLSLTTNSLSSFPEYIFSTNLLPCFDLPYEALLYLPSVHIDPCFLGLSSDTLKSYPPSTVNNLFLDYINKNFLYSA
ncbi:hypothetical protein QTP88_022428 [Uroleucon formosanum]